MLKHAFFSRYQVKYRRRREGKTDYKARLGLISQRKNKYNSYKYRLIVRFSNRDICTQVAVATISGDKIVCSAYSHELPWYGLNVGLTNYSAAYCVGLLCANRCGSKFALNTVYPGIEKIEGEDFTADPVYRGPRPFNLILDTGLKRTSTGSKVFSVLKGAIDAGIRVPYNEKRFVGFDALTKKYDANTTKNYIFGSHISDLMNDLKEEEPGKFRLQFSTYISSQIKPEDLSQLYEKVHTSIRNHPIRVNNRVVRTKSQSVIFTGNETSRLINFHKTSARSVKHTYDERKQNLKRKMAYYNSISQDY